MGKIILGFKGCGKTSFFHHSCDFLSLDVDINSFYYKDILKNKVKNSDFPVNLIKYIKRHIDKVDFILLPLNRITLNILNKYNLSYILVYPKKKIKDDYLKRRVFSLGSMWKFKEYFKNEYDALVDLCKKDKSHIKFIMDKNDYLSDLVLAHYISKLDNNSSIVKKYFNREREINTYLALNKDLYIKYKISTADTILVYFKKFKNEGELLNACK